MWGDQTGGYLVSLYVLTAEKSTGDERGNPNRVQATREVSAFP